MDATTDGQVRQLFAPGHCRWSSAAFDRSGLVVGEFCDHGAKAGSRVVQLAADLKTRLGEASIGRCAEGPYLAVDSAKDAVLVNTYVYCGPVRASQGRPARIPIGPEQLVQVFVGDHLVQVHAYTGVEEFGTGLGW